MSIICSKCNNIKLSKEFDIGRKQCKKCRSKYKYNRKKNDIGYWLYSIAKKRAKTFNIEFDISVDYVRNIIPKDNMCPILDIEMKTNNGGMPAYNSFSLDRINSNKGYIVGNVCVVSYRANMLKNNATIEELEQIIKFLKNNVT